MGHRRLLFFTSLAIAGSVLIISFYLSGQQIAAAIVLLPVGLMISTRRVSRAWMAHLSLAGFIGLSAFGVMQNIPLMLMVIASSAALASWDLALEMQSKLPTTDLYAVLHIKYLGVALGIGLLGTSLAHWIRWQLPLGGMLVLVIIMLVSLNRLMTYLEKDRGSDG